MKGNNMRWYSHSGLSAFEQCPHRYRLRYIDRVEVDVGESIACLRGSAAHFGVEMLYQELLAGRMPDLDVLLDATRKWWAEHYHDKVILPDGAGTPESYLEEALQCVRTYYDGHYPFDADETLAMEKKVFAPMNSRYGILGYIDRLVQRDGKIEVHDFKTSSRPGRHQSIFENRQLALYAMGVMHERPQTPPVKLVWHYLPKGESRTAVHNAGEYEMLRLNVLNLITAIESCTGFAKRVTPLCNWCDYIEVCKPADRRPSRNGVDLVPACAGARR
jgi:putative RecB family exonuclease